LRPPDHAAALVDLPRDGPQPHAQIDVLRARALDQRDVERRVLVLRFLGQDVVAAVVHDGPLANLAPESAGDLAGCVLLEVPGTLWCTGSGGFSARENRHQHDTEQQGGRRQCGTGRDPFEKSHLIIPLTQTVVLSPNSFGLRRATSSCKSYFLRS